jgi:hypothetical protein
MSITDALNVANRDYIADMGESAVLSDNVSQGSAYSTKLRPKARPYPGGTKITENFEYAVMPGGSHPKGVRHVNKERQTTQRGQWDLKYTKVDVVFNKIDIQVLNGGRMMVYDMLKEKMQWAYTTLGMFMEIALYLPGSGASFAQNPNGLAEVINDNSTNSWDGNTYATYADASRADANFGSRIKGNIDPIGGPISYAALEAGYSRAKVGNVQPDLGLTTEKCYSYIKNKFQTQQRFQDTTDITIGFTGLKFNKAVIIASNYVPGSFISGMSTAGDPATEYVTTTTATEATPSPPTPLWAPAQWRPSSGRTATTASPTSTFRTTKCSVVDSTRSSLTCTRMMWSAACVSRGSTPASTRASSGREPTFRRNPH